MSENAHKSGLYRWNRQSDSRVYSRSQKVSTDNDIQSWIKKVEDASDRAAEQTFGSNHYRVGGGGRSHYGDGDGGRSAALQKVQQVRDEEQTYSEAQELLSQWMSEKVHLDDDDDVEDFVDEPWRQTKVEADVKREWDHLLESNYDNLNVDMATGQPKKYSTDDMYADIENMDERSAVASILDSMLKKEVIHDAFLDDLGFDSYKTQVDPRTKMELRHQQVKENREKRERDLDKQRRDKQLKKEAYAKAKQILNREEQSKTSRKNQEEMELKKEMTRIRKQMQETRKYEEDAKARERQEKASSERLVRDEMQRREEDEMLMKQEQDQKRHEKKLAYMKKVERLQSKQAANNLKILQRHFSAWYGIILRRRLRIGKVRAMADWKLVLRVFNAWKSYIRSVRLTRETKLHEQTIRESHRKGKLAEYHHQHCLLNKYFRSWQRWLEQEHDRKDLEAEQTKTHSKMMSLLDAAATGKLWTHREDAKHDGTAVSMATNKHVAKHDGTAVSMATKGTSDAERVDQLFSSPERRKSPGTFSTLSSARSDVSDTSTKMNKKSPKMPTQQWQITRQHVQLTTDQIKEFGGIEGGEYTEAEIRNRLGNQPWLKPHASVSNFENRHKAQQQMLTEQQSQIMEQRQLIEDLQFKQNQQELNQQLSQQRLIQQQLNNLTNVRSLHGQLDGLQHNEVVKEKDTNLNLEALRTDRTPLRSVSATSTSGQSYARTHGSNTSRSDPETARSENTHVSSNVSKTPSTASTKYLSVLKNMDARAADRSRLKAEREEKRRKVEEDRLIQLEREQQERLLHEADEKKKRIEDYRDKKKAEKQLEIEKQERLGKTRAQMLQAESHHKKALMNYAGLLPWKRLVKMAKDKEEVAEDHYETTISRKVFHGWHDHVADLVQHKNKMAYEMQKYLLIHRCFSSWKKHKHYMRIQDGRAERFHAHRLKSKFLIAWKDYTTDSQIIAWKNTKTAEEHCDWQRLHKCFAAWKSFPVYIRKEQEKEKRREEMRRKVTSILPDFGDQY